MRILLATAGGLDDAGGAALILQGLASGLRELGHKVDTLGVAPPAELPAWHHRRWIIGQIEAQVRSAGPYDILDLPPPLALPGPRSPLLVVRSIQPELRYLAVDAKQALLRAVRGSPRAGLELLILARRWRWVVSGWRAADLLLCLGGAELEWMRRHAGKSRPRLRLYRAAPPGVDRRALALVRRNRVDAGSDELRFLWLGRWSAHKGTAALERFASRRLSERPRDSLTIAGCGTEPDLRSLRGVRDRVHTIPVYSRRDLPHLLATHHIGLFTSVAEGWGLSLQEMLESGLPVMATREGAVADLEPYFPGAIAPLGGNRLPTGSPPTEGYEAIFNWTTIAHEYSQVVTQQLKSQG